VETSLLPTIIIDECLLLGFLCLLQAWRKRKMIAPAVTTMLLVLGTFVMFMLLPAAVAVNFWPPLALFALIFTCLGHARYHRRWDNPLTRWSLILLGILMLSLVALM